MKHYQDIVGRINYGLFLAVVALLPFPQTPLRLACVLWIISWYLEFRWLTKPKSLRENPVAIPILLFGLWFAWKVVSVFWAPDYDAWAWQMERYMTFALIIPIGLWGVNEHYNWEQAGKVLVASCVIAIPAYLIWMAVLHPHPEWVPYLNVPEDWRHHEKWTTFLMDNISHFKHRLFLCSVELFGIIMAFQVLRKRWAILIPAVAIMFISIPMTGSRQSVLTCAALAVIGILYLLPRKQRLRYGTAIVLLGMVLGGGVLKLHPRMQQFDISDITEMRDMSYDHDIRFNIWGAALQRPQDYIAYGLGAGQSKAYLAERYDDVHFDWYASKQYHAHNQYLEETMEIGLAGMFLFVLAWISIPLSTRGRARKTAMLFTTLFMLGMMTDCMFGKFDGIALWAVGLLFILLQTHAQGDEQTAGDTETH